jgi:hypothetical protein
VFYSQEVQGASPSGVRLAELAKGALLMRVAAGEGTQVQALLLRRFRASSDPPPAAPRRTAAELWLAAADRTMARLDAEEKRQREVDARRIVHDVTLSRTGPAQCHIVHNHARPFAAPSQPHPPRLLPPIPAAPAIQTS